MHDDGKYIFMALLVVHFTVFVLIFVVSTFVYIQVIKTMRFKDNQSISGHQFKFRQGYKLTEERSGRRKQVAFAGVVD